MEPLRQAVECIIDQHCCAAPGHAPEEHWHSKHCGGATHHLGDVPAPCVTRSAASEECAVLLSLLLDSTVRGDWAGGVFCVARYRFWFHLFMSSGLRRSDGMNLGCRGAGCRRIQRRTI